MSVDDATSPPDENSLLYQAAASKQESELTDLKIDAWLGEWLSSGYYAKSEPPPPSEKLVKSAKEGLKKPPEEIKGADIANTIREFDEVNWADMQRDAKDTKAAPTYEKTGLRAMAAKGHSMPRRSRTVSLTTNRDAAGAIPASEAIGRRPRSSTYSPPVPTYSIAPQDTIPIGFVAHARDACVNPDFDWDSQQSPLEWGDGGQYEEEWSTMHRRFRNGLQSMLMYYEAETADQMETEDGESDEDLILILVTHQAGCNALIRLVTGAPALHDVGTASLTLAVRKAGLTRQQSAASSTSPSRRRGSLDLGFDDDFDMKIIASTEHLRSGSNPLGLNSPRLAMSPAFASRRMVGAESLEGFSIGDPLTWRSASSSTVTRSSSTRGHAHTGSFNSDAIDGTGLWSSARRTRTSSSSSDMNVDPRTPIPTPKQSASSGSAIVDDAMEEDSPGSAPRHPSSGFVASPVAIESQSVWQPETTPHKVRLPVRQGSTIIQGNPMAATGLWGSPLNNPGGVKEGTPYSRSSFGMTDAAAPMWGPRSSSQRISTYASKSEFGSMKEEDES